MESTHDNRRLGVGGERVAMHLIAHALEGSVQPWREDLGLDGAIQFVMTDPARTIGHLMVQIKTGDCYVYDDGGPQVRIRRVAPKHLEAWRREPELSIIFAWVDPTQPNAVYWHLIRPDLRAKRFFVSKQRHISPITRYDWTLHLRAHALIPRAIEQPLLAPDLVVGYREQAKNAYREIRNQPKPVHPVLGSVELPWRAWRHITRQSRDRDDVIRSLQLVGPLRYIIQRPSRLVGLRRLKTFHRDGYCYSTRLIVFSTRLAIAPRNQIDVRSVFRETFKYSLSWASTPKYLVERRVSLESVYQKTRSAAGHRSTLPLRVDPQSTHHA